MRPRARARLAVLAASVLAAQAGADGNLQTIAVTGADSPDGDGAFSSFQLPVLTQIGTSAFIATLDGTASTSGVYLVRRPPYDGSRTVAVPALTAILRSGQDSPDGNGQLTGFGDIAAAAIPTEQFGTNRIVSLGVSATFSDTTRGIISYGGFDSGGGALSDDAREGTERFAASVFTGFGSPRIASSPPIVGDAQLRASTFTYTAFHSNLNQVEHGIAYGGASGGLPSIPVLPRFSNSEHLLSRYRYASIDALSVQLDSTRTEPVLAYRGRLTDVFDILNQPVADFDAILTFRDAAAGNTVPVILDDNRGDASVSFGPPVTNQSFNIAYRRFDAGSQNQEIMLQYSGAPDAVVSATGEVTPDAGSEFVSFGDPALNRWFGQVAFRADTRTLAGAQNGAGLLRYQSESDTLEFIVRTGDTVAGRTFTHFSDPLINTPGVLEPGVLLFGATSSGTGGALQGLYLADGIDLLPVVETGDTLEGSTVVQAEAILEPDPGGRSSFNDAGQVAFRAALADGRQGVFVYTPEILYRGGAAGSFDVASDWRFGMRPRDGSVVTIAPSAGHVELRGPQSSGCCEVLELGDLTLRPGAGATVEFIVPSGENFRVDGTLTIAANASLRYEPGPFELDPFQVGHLQLAGGAARAGDIWPIRVNSVSGFGTLVGAEIATSVITGEIEADGGVLTLDDLRLLPGIDVTVAPGAELRVLDSSGNGYWLERWNVDVDGGQLTLVADSRVFESRISIAGGTLEVSAPSVWSVESESELELAGGTLNAPAGIELASGARIRGHGTINAVVDASSETSIEASGGTLSVGDPNSLFGFQSRGQIVVNEGASLDLRSRVKSANLGKETRLTGGRLRSESGVFLPGTGALAGFGEVEARVAAQTGSAIVAEGDLALGDANALDGFFSDGLLVVGSNRVTLNDANASVLGSLTELGDGQGGGTLVAANGLLLEFGKNLSGHGDVVADLLNNGFVEGVGPPGNDLLNLHGLVKGVGAYGGTVAFLGTFSPGLSPAEVELESFVSRARTVIELGGLIPGAQFDVIDASGTAALGGTLEIDLLGGFVPDPGDRFAFLYATGGIDGRFERISAPALAGLVFGVSYAESIVTLEVSQVPLPAAGWMLVTALSALLWSSGRQPAARGRRSRS